MSRENFALPSVQIENVEKEIMPKSTEVGIEEEISDKQLEKFATTTEEEIMRASEILPEAKKRIESSAKSLDVSPDTLQAVREESGLDTQLNQIQAKANQVAIEASLEIKKVTVHETGNVATAELVQEPPYIQKQEKVFTEQQLRDRYEEMYRDKKAAYFWSERQNNQKNNKNKIAQIQGYITDAPKTESMMVKSAAYRRDSSNSSPKYHLEILEKNKRNLMQEKQKRGFFERLKFKIIDDPLRARFFAVEEATRPHLSEIFKNNKEFEKEKNIQALYKEKSITRANELLQEQHNAKELSRKYLLERTHTVNTSSKEAIKNTKEELEKGNLDISKLAKESNAIVVHAIPLEGWSMANTSMNNNVVDVTKLTSHDKISIVKDKLPDLSASIISAGEKIAGQGLMYPFGLVLDGKIIASYGEDSSSITKGDARYLKYGEPTLQSNPVNQFKKISKVAARGMTNSNESIVHLPKIKGILIDEDYLNMDYLKGDRVTETYPREQESEMLQKYGDSVISSPALSREIMGEKLYDKFPELRTTTRITRKRGGMEKALEYADTHYPDLPVYIRRKDGIYTREGKKVTAEDIYR